MTMTLSRNAAPVYAAITTIAISLGACSGAREKEGNDTKPIETMALSETYVDTMNLVLKPFDNQSIYNGRLQALSASVLTFPKAGVITSITVKEGQRVAKGAIIATVDSREQRRSVEKAEHEVEKAHVSFVDQLIGMGYTADLKDVPDDVRRRAEITSGYYSAKYELESARRVLDECELRAPVAGRIASVVAKLHETSDKVCTIIDDSAFDVEFKVLEAELADIHEGDIVTVSPFVDDSLRVTGHVNRINPQVDDKGMVRVVARVAGGNRGLLDGMNMRIVVNRRVEKAFVVPKDAVVERDGYHVVFLLRDGKALWTYVDVIHSNINSFAITGCARKDTHISEGDIVITSGNLNLADGTPVKVK